MLQQCTWKLNVARQVRRVFWSLATSPTEFVRYRQPYYVNDQHILAAETCCLISFYQLNMLVTPLGFSHIMKIMTWLEMPYEPQN